MRLGSLAISQVHFLKVESSVKEVAERVQCVLRCDYWPHLLERGVSGDGEPFDLWFHLWHTSLAEDKGLGETVMASRASMASVDIIDVTSFLCFARQLGSSGLVVWGKAGSPRKSVRKFRPEPQS